MKTLAILVSTLSLVLAAFGAGTNDAIHRWNTIAINASGLDHTPVAPGENRVFGEQVGPGRSARAMAIVHIAMFDTLNAVVGGYKGFTDVQAPAGPISVDAAISQAAHDALVALFPSQAVAFDAFLSTDLAGITNGFPKSKGVALGQLAAVAVLETRIHDGSEHPEPHLGTDWTTSNLAGHWRQDPISKHPLALGGHWGECIPFTLQASNQFRAPPFPAMTSPEYAVAYDEVKRVGGDGVVTSTQRTPEQTQVGIFWAYDGTPSLCAPPRLYNQITMQIADQKGTTGIELARLLALVNMAMADAGIAIWESKYFYDVWRPITGIRESDPGTGPTGAGDGNGATVGDPTFTPLGAPASNLEGPNFTPPFPAYPSGHAGFGGSLFQTLRRFYGTDDIEFTFVSDEFNGTTRGNDGAVRPYLPRHFSKLSQAEEENGQSRIYLGIHWSFDKTEGIALGRKVGDYVFDHALRPQSVASLAGDTNGDGIVDENEVNAVLANYWSQSSLVISNPTKLAGGGFQIGVTNLVGWNLSVQVSTNLVTWNNLPTAAVPVYQFQDSGTDLEPHRFYRLHLP